MHKPRSAWSRCFIVLSLVLFLPGSASGWGGDVHRIINRAAAETLPESFIAFSSNADRLAALSTAADARKSWDNDESVRHYIDIDVYPEFFAGTLPHAWSDMLALYSRYTVERNGILPWAIEDTYGTLVARFQNRDWDGAVTVAADLGHYVGDLHNPLHLTENFDGQLTDQDGIHSRFESRMTGRYLEYLTPRAFTPTYVEDPLEGAFDWIDGQYPGLRIILDADLAAVAEARSNRSDEYYAIMWAELGADTQDWIRLAAERLASLWYSAWVDAGSPLLPGSTPVASLLDFQAAAAPGGIELRWSVADPEPVRFIVQRREEGGLFVPLPEAVVENTEVAYPAFFSWRDEAVSPGASYEYRLEVLLRDGAREIWERSVSAQAGGVPLVRFSGANPVRGSGPLGVAVELSSSESVRVALYDAAGRVVGVLQDGTWGPGRHTAELGAGQTRRLPAGVYFLSVRTASHHQSQRVVVLD